DERWDAFQGQGGLIRGGGRAVADGPDARGRSFSVQCSDIARETSRRTCSLDGARGRGTLAPIVSGAGYPADLAEELLDHGRQIRQPRIGGNAPTHTGTGPARPGGARHPPTAGPTQPAG